MLFGAIASHILHIKKFLSVLYIICSDCTVIKNNFLINKSVKNNSTVHEKIDA